MAPAKPLLRLLLAIALLLISPRLLLPTQETPQDRANRDRARADRRREEARRLAQQQQRDSEERRRDQARRDRAAETARANSREIRSQSIIFPAIPPQRVGSTLTMRAYATSGLGVSYTGGGRACSVSFRTAHMLSMGLCTITAHQLGNSKYHPAQSVSRTFAVK